jgi:hypothetical protein
MRVTGLNGSLNLSFQITIFTSMVISQERLQKRFTHWLEQKYTRKYGRVMGLVLELPLRNQFLTRILGNNSYNEQVLERNSKIGYCVSLISAGGMLGIGLLLGRGSDLIYPLFYSALYGLEIYSTSNIKARVLKTLES